MSEAIKKEQQILAALSDALAEELKKQGSAGFAMVAIKMVGETEADVWTRLHCTPAQLANMFAYALSTAPQDDMVEAAIGIILGHPLIAPRLGKSVSVIHGPAPEPEQGAETASPDIKEWVN